MPPSLKQNNAGLSLTIGGVPRRPAFSRFFPGRLAYRFNGRIFYSIAAREKEEGTVSVYFIAARSIVPICPVIAFVYS